MFVRAYGRLRSPLVVVVLGAVIVASGVLLAARPAWACSCGVTSLDEAYGRSDAVFTGSIEEVRSPVGGSSVAPRRFLVRADAVYKGDVRAAQWVVTAASGASCGYAPAHGAVVLLFATRGGDGIVDVADDTLVTNLCSGNAAASDVPVSFGAPQAPVAGASALPLAGSGDRVSATAVVVTIVVVAAVALVAAHQLRARRHARPNP